MRWLLLLALLPYPVAAQHAAVVTIFGAQNDALRDSPRLYGAALSSGGGVLGLRLGGAAGEIEHRPGSAGIGQTTVGVWTADADLLLTPGAASPVLAALLPAGFVGLGLQGARDAEGAMRAIPVVSYGARATLPLIARTQLEAEGRYRRPLHSDDAADGAGRGWEYRLGIGIRLGGSSSRSGAARSARGLPLPDDAVIRRTAVDPRHVLRSAESHLGTRYTYGGTSPQTGFDCSGFVQYVYRAHGVALPRTSRQLSAVGRRIATSLGSLRAGDLMFFARDGSRIDHVAIYAGDGRIIHSSSSGKGVRYDDLSKPRGRWFVDHWVATRRVAGPGALTGDDLLRTLAAAQRMAARLDPPDVAPAP